MVVVLYREKPVNSRGTEYPLISGRFTPHNLDSVSAFVSLQVNALYSIVYYDM